MHGRFERVECPGQPAEDEARSEAHRDVGRLRVEGDARSVSEIEGDAIGQAGIRGTLDRGGVELRSDLDSLYRTAELRGQKDGRSTPAAGDVEHTRSRAEPKPLPEETKLLLGNRVLEDMVALCDDEVARDHAGIFIQPR